MFWLSSFPGLSKWYEKQKSDFHSAPKLLNNVKTYRCRVATWPVINFWKVVSKFNKNNVICVQHKDPRQRFLKTLKQLRKLSWTLNKQYTRNPWYLFTKMKTHSETEMLFDGLAGLNKPLEYIVAIQTG